MRAKARRPTRLKLAASGSGCQAGSCSLLALPVEVLHQVLDLLDPHDLVKLLHTSKAIAVQHSSGKLTFQCKEGKLAAIRQLLWAPPSTLKLILDARPTTLHDWGSVMHSLQIVLPAPSSRQDLRMMQLPCLFEVCIQGLTLPGLAPAGLTAVCPKLHTLQLHHCTIQDDKGASNRSHGHSSIASTSSGSTGANGSTDTQIATHLHTLVLRHTCIHGLDVGPARGMVTRSHAAAVEYRKQLRRSLPNLTSLTMQYGQNAIVQMFGPQLTELRLLNVRSTSDLQWWSSSIVVLQQLQKLVLPDFWVSGRDMKTLLILPSLIHVELSSTCDHFEEDYSSYPCKWQILHLHLQNKWQRIDTLAKLPVHSLVQPLRLGGQCEESMVLELPPSTQEDSSGGNLEIIAQRLAKRGVQVLAPHIAWACPCDGPSPWIESSKHAQAMTAIGPIFGLRARVTLFNMVVEQPFLEAVGSVYGAGLQQLVLEECAFQQDMLPAWHAALSGLPALQKVELTDCCYVVDDDYLGSDRPKMVQTVRQLAAAMAQQPDGRCIEVMCKDVTGMTCCNSKRFAQLVLDGADAFLMGVEVMPQDTMEGMGSDDSNEDDGNDDDNAVESCIRIASKHRSA